MKWIGYLQSLIPILAGLSLLPKLILSAIVVLITALFLVLIWMPPQKKVAVSIEGQLNEKIGKEVQEQGIRKINLPESGKAVGTGWLRDVPDRMDFTKEHDAMVSTIKRLGLADERKNLPNNVDLRPWFHDVKNQGALNTSAVHSIVAMVEYFENRAFGLLFDGSRLFVYKNARNLMNLRGDSGTSLRATLQAVQLLGIPTEEQWPYSDDNTVFDSEPPTFVYGMARNYQAFLYFSHDPMSMKPKNEVLNSVKESLAAGIPSAFGFFGFSTFDKSGVKGEIPYPCKYEQPKWGQAVVAVGYDDEKIVHNTKCREQTIGALLIRNSWGKEWGDQGYGWLPYEYVMTGQAADFWSIVSYEWVVTNRFGIGVVSR